MAVFILPSMGFSILTDSLLWHPPMLVSASKYSFLAMRICLNSQKPVASHNSTSDGRYLIDMVNSRDVHSVVLGRFLGNGSLQRYQTQRDDPNVDFRAISGGSSVFSVY